MAAFNVVRFRTKQGKQQEFITAHKKAERKMAGFRKGTLIQTGEQTFCFIGEWDSMESIVAARPSMIALLDGFRDMLEDLGSGLGVTDPVSGSVVAEMQP
jgi:quinol monooxygenase YgiN